MKIPKTAIIKRSQLALLSITLMLTIAGYINYKYNPDREKNLGQTVYVNGKDSYTYKNVDIYSDTNNTDSSEVNSDKNVDADKEATKQTEAKTNTTQENQDNDAKQSSIAVFKYDRDNMFSELSENYREIISNANTTKEEINTYQNKLNELISKKNLITMVENVIKSKGITDIVIIPTNNDNLNVVIKSDTDLKAEQIAQIQNVLETQFGVKADKISISTVKN